jgi:hypothetical protein
MEMSNTHNTAKAVFDMMLLVDEKTRVLQERTKHLG